MQKLHFRIVRGIFSSLVAYYFLSEIILRAQIEKNTQMSILGCPLVVFSSFFYFDSKLTPDEEAIVSNAIGTMFVNE